MISLESLTGQMYIHGILGELSDIVRMSVCIDDSLTKGLLYLKGSASFRINFKVVSHLFLPYLFCTIVWVLNVPHKLIC